MREKKIYTQYSTSEYRCVLQCLDLKNQTWDFKNVSTNKNWSPEFDRMIAKSDKESSGFTKFH